ncbi:MAG: ImpA family metalloprotease [Moraxella sp.]|nr:ImpA family metalloprotease [Moraxella sp.]
MYTQKSALSLAVGLSLLLTACGGGSDGGSSATSGGTTSTPTVTPSGNNTANSTNTKTTASTDDITSRSTTSDSTSKPALPVITPASTPKERIDVALATGDASVLQAADETTLLQQLITEASAKQKHMRDIVYSILHDANGKALDLRFTGTTNSITLRASNPFISRNLLVSNTGTPLSTIADVEGARFLGYGVSVMYGVVNDNNYPYFNHTSVLNRSLNWLVTGNANTAMPASLTIAYQGYPSGTLTNYFKKHYPNTTLKLVECQFFNPNNTCWQTADLFVIGNRTPTAADLQNSEAMFAKYKAAKKPVLYMGSGWGAGDNNQNHFVNYYGIGSNSYPGNYFDNANNYKSDNTNNTTDKILANSEMLNSLINVLQTINQNKAVNASELNAMKSVVTTLRNFYYQQNNAGLSVFDKSENQIAQKMALLADSWRKDVVYDGFNYSNVNLANKYLKTLIADNWIDFNRPLSIAPTKGAGDYMPASANSLPVSSTWEEIDVTLPQGSGYATIGRASIPAKGVQVEVVNNGTNATIKSVPRLHIQTGNIRAVQDRDIQDGKKTTYVRPDKSTSASVLLNGVTDFNSPYGGVLMLRYNNATAGQVVRLRIKGVAKYAHFDFTRPMSNTEINEAVQAMKDNKFGWNTFKFLGAEIQQTNAYALRAVGNQDPKVYVDNIKTVIFDSNHIANGYNNMPLDSSTAQYCTTLGWNCTGNLHSPPSVQYMVGWIAQCGYLCSGNPVDAYTGVDLGWGWVHELGHNTVQRVLSMDFNGKGCQAECDNNILAGLSMLRKRELLGQDSNGGNFAHWTLYNQIKASRETKVDDKLLSGEALRVNMENRLWNGDGYTNPNAKQAMTMQLALLYTKHKQGKAKPDSQGVFEFFRLINIANRLVDNLNMTTATAADKAKYGLGGYSDKGFNTPELVYMLSSKIIGKDMKDVFEMYGLPVSAKAHGSVAMLNLPVAPLDFYAQPQNRANFLNEGQWLTVPAPATGTMVVYPYTIK